MNTRRSRLIVAFVAAVLLAATTVYATVNYGSYQYTIDGTTQTPYTSCPLAAQNAGVSLVLTPEVDTRYVFTPGTIDATHGHYLPAFTTLVIKNDRQLFIRLRTVAVSTTGVGEVSCFGP